MAEILKVAASASVAQKTAAPIIDEVRSVIGRWRQFADEAGLMASRRDELDQILNP